MTLSTKELMLNAEQPWRYRKVQSSMKQTLQKIRHVACSSVCTSCGTSVRGSRKCYNFILKCPFSTRFPLIPCKEPQKKPPKFLTQIWETLWIINPSEGQGVMSSSECIKSRSSMKLVNFVMFLNFCLLNIFLQTFEKDKFNALEITPFLVFAWRRNIALLA